MAIERERGVFLHARAHPHVCYKANKVIAVEKESEKVEKMTNIIDNLIALLLYE